MTDSQDRAPDGPAASLPPHWEELRARLLAVRGELFAALRAYPPPIAGCDQQFNHLLEQRERVARELRELDALAERSLPAGTDARALESFVRASAFLQGPWGKARQE